MVSAFILPCRSSYLPYAAQIVVPRQWRMFAIVSVKPDMGIFLWRNSYTRYRHFFKSGITDSFIKSTVCRYLNQLYIFWKFRKKRFQQCTIGNIIAGNLSKQYVSSFFIHPDMQFSPGAPFAPCCRTFHSPISVYFHTSAVNNEMNWFVMNSFGAYANRDKRFCAEWKVLNSPVLLQRRRVVRSMLGLENLRSASMEDGKPREALKQLQWQCR